MHCFRILASIALGAFLANAVRGAELGSSEGRAALRKAVGFFVDRAAKRGGYVWRYSRDFSMSEGEGETPGETIWVQPPGTPSVGMVLLDAYEATGDQYYLGAAKGAARALVAGQLQSGGWYYRIEFDPAERERWGYCDNPGFKASKTKKNRTNITTLDDDTTQAALEFLCRIDAALNFRDRDIHGAARFAADALVAAQRANGGWSQNWNRYPDDAYRREFPVKAASFPETWSRKWLNDWPGRYYTNDNVMENTIRALLAAYQTYRDQTYLEAAMRAGEFLILAQLPDPQPAWAQQYDADMHPCWDRKFEPPAISSVESVGVMRALIEVYRATGEKRFLEPIPRAVAWLEKSLLSDGRAARFYELKTNKPLYFKIVDNIYELTYDDSVLPDHYGFQADPGLDSLKREITAVRGLGREYPPSKTSAKTRAERARKVIAQMDDRGGWMSDRGMRGFGKVSQEGVYESDVFIKNVETLCEFLVSLRK